ncbi:MATE family efflux transporter [Pendulispora brunnea]|uniref:Multidrug-efflux transporter n=1 Tax=Pendulispora brunnea TaxID=2905690 RepID=A0ABZ2KM79_9BACT
MFTSLFKRYRLKRWVAHVRRLLARAGRPSSTTAAAQVSARARTRAELFKLAWPIVIAMSAETMLGLVDTKLVGGLGPAALGGVGLATMMMYVGYSLVFGAMRAVKVQTAHAVGEGRPQDGIRYAQAGILMAVGIGVALFILGRDISWLLRALGVDHELIAPARDFFSAVTYGSVGVTVLVALYQHRQATGDTRTPMIVGIVANIFNGFFAYGLIYGHWGLPALGVRGAGFATATSEYLECAMLGALLLRDMKRCPPSTLRLREACRGVWDLGMPTAIHFGAETLAFTTFTAVLGTLASAEIASHQVAMATIRTSFLPGVAIAEAASILVGRSLGEKRLDEADRATWAALQLAIGFMAVCGVLFAVFGGALAHGFSTDPEVIRITRNLLLVAAVFQVLDAVNIVLRGALRGAKDVRVTAIIGVTVVWTCVPTAAYVLGKLAGLGALGGWLGFIGETTFSATLFWLRYWRGPWRQGYVPPSANTGGASLAQAENARLHAA